TESVGPASHPRDGQRRTGAERGCHDRRFCRRRGRGDRREGALGFRRAARFSMHELVGPRFASRRSLGIQTARVPGRRHRDTAPRAPRCDRNHGPDTRGVGDRMIRRAAASILAAIAFLSGFSTPAQAASAPGQYRALWVDAFHDGMKSPAQVEKLVADTKRANLNTLIVQVRKRGDAYFAHSIEPRATDIVGPSDFDPLDYLLRLAHASTPRIDVHASV